MDLINLSAVRQNFGNVVYTYKIHEYCSEQEINKKRNYNILNLIIVFFILVSLLLGAYSSCSKICTFLSAGLSVIEITILISFLMSNPENKSLRHKKSALELIYIRERYISLMADIFNSAISPEEIRSRRDLLINECKKIYENSPETNHAAFKEIQKRLNPKGAVDGEEFTFTDDEIDRFLPEKLRLSSLK